MTGAVIILYLKQCERLMFTITGLSKCLINVLLATAKARKCGECGIHVPGVRKSRLDIKKSEPAP
jgi:hypothetical protein